MTLDWANKEARKIFGYYDVAEALRAAYLRGKMDATEEKVSCASNVSETQRSTTPTA